MSGGGCRLVRHRTDTRRTGVPTSCPGAQAPKGRFFKAAKRVCGAGFGAILGCGRALNHAIDPAVAGFAFAGLSVRFQPIDASDFGVTRG